MDATQTGQARLRPPELNGELPQVLGREGHFRLVVPSHVEVAYVLACRVALSVWGLLALGVVKHRIEIV